MRFVNIQSEPLRSEKNNLFGAAFIIIKTFFLIHLKLLAKHSEYHPAMIESYAHPSSSPNHHTYSTSNTTASASNANCNLPRNTLYTLPLTTQSHNTLQIIEPRIEEKSKGEKERDQTSESERERSNMKQAVG
jgi:hypothetical protein